MCPYRKLFLKLHGISKPHLNRNISSIRWIEHCQNLLQRKFHISEIGESNLMLFIADHRAVRLSMGLSVSISMRLSVSSSMGLILSTLLREIWCQYCHLWSTIRVFYELLYLTLEHDTLNLNLYSTIHCI